MLSGDGNWLISTLNEQALATETRTGKRIKLLKGVCPALFDTCDDEFTKLMPSFVLGRILPPSLPSP